MCCKRLDTGCKNDAKNRHLSTIAQLCRTISLQLRHVSTIRKKLVKQQYLLHMSQQYSELRPTSGWDRSASLGHPCKFQWVSHLGSVNARHSSSGRQSNCGVEQRAPPIFGRATITLGVGPHSSLHLYLQFFYWILKIHSIAQKPFPELWNKRPPHWSNYTSLLSLSSKRGRDMAIFRFFKMAVAAILDF